MPCVRQGVNSCIADLHVVDGTCVSAESSKLSGNMQSVDYMILLDYMLLMSVLMNGIYALNV